MSDEPPPNRADPDIVGNADGDRRAAEQDRATIRDRLPDVEVTITADTSEFERATQDATVSALELSVAMWRKRAEQAEAAIERATRKARRILTYGDAYSRAVARQILTALDQPGEKPAARPAAPTSPGRPLCKCPPNACQGHRTDEGPPPDNLEPTDA